jgi:hypothetical protein
MARLLFVDRDDFWAVYGTVLLLLPTGLLSAWLWCVVQPEYLSRHSHTLILTLTRILTLTLTLTLTHLLMMHACVQ